MKPLAIFQLLRRNGYKVTPQRQSVIGIIVKSHDCLTPGAIYDRVKRDCPTIGLVTVYRVLDILAKLGLLCRVHAEDGCRSYLMRRPEGHHHHIVCSSCGRVADFSECNLDKLQDIVARTTGYEISGHLLELEGICHDCLNKRLTRRVRHTVYSRHAGAVSD